MKKTRILIVEALRISNWDRINPAFLVFFVSLIILIIGIVVDALEFLIGGAAIIIAVYTIYLVLKFKE